jgi:hypothetical protein
MLKPKTHFEQVALEIVRRLVKVPLADLAETKERSVPR